MVEADILGSIIAKFTTPDVNLSPHPTYDHDGNLIKPGLDNHTMGTIFEELIRLFNEENNEEAGEHFTPRDVVTLMANLIFTHGSDKDATYSVYDGACGTGSMPVAESTGKTGCRTRQDVSIHLFGQEIQPERMRNKTDMLLKGRSAADNIRVQLHPVIRCLPHGVLASCSPTAVWQKLDYRPRTHGRDQNLDPRFG